MTSNGLPLIPYMRQSRSKERTISIEEQRRDIQAWPDVELGPEMIEQNVSGSKPWRERALGEARRFGWSHSTTRQLLSNGVYLGEITLDGEVKENAHAALVTPELFAAVQASRTIQAVAPGDTTRDRLLIGLAVCGGCGKTLKTLRRSRADGTYVVSYYCKDAAAKPCPERGYVHADELDAFVTDWFTAALKSVPRMIDVVATNDALEEARAELSAAESQLNAYVDKMDATARGFRRGYDERERRVSEAEERVTHLAGRSTLAASLPPLAWWDRFDVFRRRTILAGYLGSVIVSLGASSDLEAHVQILWRDDSIAFPEVAGKNARTRKQAA
jgi:hypothetical protein